MLRICGGLCDRRADKAFHLDLALLTSLECTSNSSFSCYNTENTIQSCQPGQTYFRSDIVLYQEYVHVRASVRVRARVKHAHTNTNVINNKTHILCKFILVSLTTEHQHNN